MERYGHVGFKLQERSTKVVIEAQQRMIDFDPARPILATRMDLSAVTFARLMTKLMKSEARQDRVEDTA